MSEKINILAYIQVILCNTSHSGNIGAAARAMKTMGITNLTLVAPAVLPDSQSMALASNANDVLENVKIVTTLDEALCDTVLAFAMTARRRQFNQNLMTPKQCVSEIFTTIQAHQKVALVFGSERSGLTQTQIEKCNRLVTIPGNHDYSSLNLAAAVQILCYEIYANYDDSLIHLKTQSQMATLKDNQSVLEHLNIILSKIDFYLNKNRDTIMRRLQNIIYKSNLERMEVDFLRGILHKIEEKLK